MPVAIPVNTPPVLIVPLAGRLLLQVPPVVASVRVVFEPAQTTGVPPINAGNGFTVIGNVVEQPAPIEYVMVTVPVRTPVTSPVEEPIVAVAGVLLVQIPPDVRSDKVTVEFRHT